jgi:hypothetical protein
METKLSESNSSVNVFVQLDIKDRPKVKNCTPEFTKTKEEREFLKKEMAEYKYGMFRLFGLNWKRMSEILNVYNVPMIPETKMAVQRQAESKNLR